MGVFSTLFGAGRTQAKLDEQDRALAELNRQALERGRFDQDTYELAQRNLNAGKINVESQVRGAFGEGLAEGAGNIRSGINSFAARLLSIFPAWVYGVAALAALVWFWPAIRPVVNRFAK